MKKSVPLPGRFHPEYTSVSELILHDAIPFSVDSPETFNASIDTLIASLGNTVALPGLGEALHGGEDILILSNRLFQHLVETHGYRAIAIESSFPPTEVPVLWSG